MLEGGADLGVVDGEGGGVGEAARQFEFDRTEPCRVAESVEIERTLDLGTSYQRHGDECLRLDRGPGHHLGTGVEVRGIGQHSLAVLDRPPGDAEPEHAW